MWRVTYSSQYSSGIETRTMWCTTRLGIWPRQQLWLRWTNDKEHKLFILLLETMRSVFNSHAGEDFWNSSSPPFQKCAIIRFWLDSILTGYLSNLLIPVWSSQPNTNDWQSATHLHYFEFSLVVQAEVAFHLCVLCVEQLMFHICVLYV